MRYQLLKKNSTKAERVFYELLKELKIPFKHRWIVHGKEIDFIIREYAIEINGHSQDGERNQFLVDNGYIPIHFTNDDVCNHRDLILNTIKQLTK